MITEHDLQEAIARYRAKGWEDKARLLSWRQEDYLDEYAYGDFADYYYGELAPSTGYLQVWDILPVKGGVMLASDTALNLIKRGFGKYLGVDVRKWQGKIPVNELILATNCRVNGQQKMLELVPLNDDVEISSYVFNTTDYEHYENLFPGSTNYKNELGGTVFVFSGTPATEFRLDTAFSFLNYSRKQQLLNMVDLANELPVYYPNDEEVYLKAADMENGDLFCAAFNIGLDPIDSLEICCKYEVKKIKKLLPNGESKEISFTYENGRYILDTPCNILDPVILFIER